MQAILFPNISPVAFSVYGFEIYWYSFAYILGFVIGLSIIKKINYREAIMNDDAVDDMLIYSVIWLVIGARIGFCLFYNFDQTIANPITILYLRDGGMSFHGGLIGLIIAAYMMRRKYGVSFLRMGDLMACVAPIGLFLGRVANFINAEMYGKVTSMPWGVIFPNAGALPRHPSQLYEAFLEGVVLFILMIRIRPYVKTQYGKLSAIFLMTYGVMRFFVEIFKDATDGHIWILTTGQVLCIPMILGGIYLYRRTTI